MWRILIIEDSPTNMLLTVEILSSAGHIPLEATTAAAGIDLARRECPDAILMDIHLPDMNGIEATRILKSDPQTRDIPVIALTALAMKGDDQRMLEAGCDGYIAKPIHYKEFLTTMTAVVRRNRTGPAA